MDWFDLPSLNNLRAFTVVAETGSYSRAGTVLNVSQAAVSQQVRALETRLGVILVSRKGRGIALTAEGAALAKALTTGFAAIHFGVETLTGANAHRPVQVTMSPAFAVRWLMPRIRDFQQRHPAIELMLNPTAEVKEPTPGGIDVAVRFCNGDWPGMEVTPFLLPDMVVVGAASLVGTQKITDLAVFADMPWLQELGTNEVAEWMERRGIAPKRQIKIIHMPGNMIMEAVRRGDGLTYTARIFVNEELGSGQLLELFSENDTGGYYIVTRPGLLRPPAKAFVKWLKRQAAMEGPPDSEVDKVGS
jgi:LysR family glycine cleavage system transcriptional activator